MASMSFKLTGFKELDARLKLLSSDIATKVGQQADRAGAVVLAKAVEAAAPDSRLEEGHPMRQGRKGGGTREYPHSKIKNNVKVRKTRNVSSTKVQSTVTAGPAFQASFEEFGSIHNRPTRFFSRAVLANMDAAVAAISAGLNKRLTKRGV